MKIPMLDLHAQYEALMPEIRRQLDKVFASHHYIMGAQVKEFEEKMQGYLGIKHAIGCASGTDALVLAVKALQIGQGDEIITTPFTFFATASSIWRNHARPVFVDIDPKTFNLDPSKIEAAITPNTKAIMPVHLFGQCSDMPAIMDIARRHNLKVIEDNAQGIGSTWDNKMSCSFGDIGTLSFFPSKNLGAMGDAGMCLTNDDDLAAALRQLRVHGEGPKYYHKCVGLNSRLDTVQAAVLLVKLDHLAAWSKARRANAAFYDRHLAGIDGLTTPYIDPKAQTIYNQYTLIASRRDELMQHLKKKDLACAVYYPLPLHLQECFSEMGGKQGDMPVSEELAEKVLSIPIYPELTEDMQQYVVDSITEFYR
ncbi:MAG: DegT/DnrJ/EryC1/StrS family aminotransferase [Candidatus Cloacimonadaceae bacterium]|jgi:dTDP-4-amino-4,6-dideoxygalactose transaminase|nr:DegT/DnrJ/EryC1/StrS family aminotransferase [Candidatus Cloacimonadota bacterium]MDY0128245.1 DegT/DnrJ/EryC1/StrS family aminotransferase [Candidatus Cloacimonadaceae bacterium]MCB5254013.1 DegT/DnrJ/EryC1/StrS family aminotransferase [Candidatus Cloacimonadota bacterium]MCK9178694.1 DegT/DnrJ/EryC1/StrS family aminotransferase [Candidatus Cloacimonadota bacterium]MCK9243241.1 DegT/DnrJ/EryC1/StrS family aminotransferase [Candidatus Cloacimonadota bacterium]